MTSHHITDIHFFCPAMSSQETRWNPWIPGDFAEEKTKIVAKLAPKASGAPVREPRIDENTHKARKLGCGGRVATGRAMIGAKWAQ